MIKATPIDSQRKLKQEKKTPTRKYSGGIKNFRAIR